MTTPTIPHPPWCSPDRCEIQPDHPGLGDHRSEPVLIMSNQPL